MGENRLVFGGELEDGKLRTLLTEDCTLAVETVERIFKVIFVNEKLTLVQGCLVGLVLWERVQSQCPEICDAIKKVVKLKIKTEDIIPGQEEPKNG